MASSAHFGLRMKMSNLKRWIRSAMWRYWGRFGTTQRNGSRSTVFQLDGATPTHQMTPLSGLESDLMTDWSAWGVMLSGQRIHHTWTPICFICGLSQNNVYKNNAQTIGELKAAITGKIRQIPKEECVKVIDNYARRVQVCLQRRGQHFILFWKEHKNYANWLRWLKLCGQIDHP